MKGKRTHARIGRLMDINDRKLQDPSNQVLAMRGPLSRQDLQRHSELGYVRIVRHINADI